MTHLNPGDKAPNFKGVDENGNTVELKDFKGKKLALFFYFDGFAYPIELNTN